MIKYFLISIFIFSIGCVKKNKVYYCGDHICKNKKEAKAYFEQNLVLEVITKNKRNDEAIDLVKLNNNDNSDFINSKKKLPLYNFLKKKNKNTNDNIAVKKNEIINPKENNSKNSPPRNPLYKFLNKEKFKEKENKKDIIQKVVKKNDNQNNLENNVKISTNNKKKKMNQFLQIGSYLKMLKKITKYSVIKVKIVI